MTFLQMLFNTRHADGRRIWWIWNLFYFLPPLALANWLDLHLRPYSPHPDLLWSLPLGLLTQGLTNPSTQLAWCFLAALAALRLPADLRRARDLGISPTAFWTTLAAGLLATLTADYLTATGNPASLPHYALTTLTMLGLLALAGLYLKLALMPSKRP